MTQHELVSFHSARIEALYNRHQALAQQIDQEHKRPASNPLYIRQLKMLKLRIKDEIEEAKGKSAA